MPGSYGTPIANLSLQLQRLHIGMPPMAILDAAMAGHEFEHPDFQCLHPEYDDWLYPPSPFAELLREAFAPEITQEQLQAWVGHVGDFAETERRWQGVIDAFAERYHLWA